jgi:hypothetical protein
VAAGCPHICSLVEEHGLEKTGEAVFERGRRAIVYYECDEASQAFVARYFSSAHRWLGHRLGEQMHLKCAAGQWTKHSSKISDGRVLIAGLLLASVLCMTCTLDHDREHARAMPSLAQRWSRAVSAEASYRGVPDWLF